jgi:hypothetical protein
LNKSKISADNRLLLESLVRLLIEYDGLIDLDEANRLLAAGNYRALDQAEIEQDITFSHVIEDLSNSRAIGPFPAGRVAIVSFASGLPESRCLNNQILISCRNAGITNLQEPNDTGSKPISSKWSSLF